MSEIHRIKEHPILEIKEKKSVPFYWNDQKLFAHEGEMIASALIAHGIHVFGHHVKDKSPQGIFCANGQCAQCTVIANGIPVKSCMTPVSENMIVRSCEGLPELPEVDEIPSFDPVVEYETDVLIIGGGPSGLSAAIELSNYNVPLILIDDKSELGGKLVLQTHKFFGSIKDCYAGTRGIDIAKILSDKLSQYETATVWTDSTALYVFSDKKVGVLKNNSYILIKPKIVLNAAGAREKMLIFLGNTLPGVYGAGAFQTLVNRDLVVPSKKIFIIGGGNVGLIAGYHALQAGIQVVGLAEALPKCGGYKVHKDKLQRLGVPIYTSHTILSANGKDQVESITIAGVDENFKTISGTEKTIACDTILIAVGLNPIDEFHKEAEEAGMKVFSTGDAEEIAEASSAMFNGKITGIKIAKALNKSSKKIPEEWSKKALILKSSPERTLPYILPEANEGVFPVFHCVQEIPCNPCTSVCPLNQIKISDESLLGLPTFEGECTGCMKCLTVCPALAITMVDYRRDLHFPIVSIPYEIGNHPVEVGQVIKVVDLEGELLEELPVINIRNTNTKTQIIQVKAPSHIAKKIAGLRIQEPSVSNAWESPLLDTIDDKVIVCRCERVTAGEIRKWIRKGITDMNQLKQLTRAGMGACGGKTCESLILRMYKEEGYSLQDITYNTRRPLYIEVPLEILSITKEK
jgi:NADPH-dependent 2,4-dienoyl-CoA reductase/sulfur reductase-like enzyme/Pyruvate/2-oxoacid:ferredoxin oxidoreductase delta subunit/bacterioferritin-associated ferredoxin